MDFFSQQENAKRYTRVLLGYFVVAVILIVLAINVIAYYFLKIFELYPYTPQGWVTGTLMYYISLATVSLILFGSFLRWNKLRTGGQAVAKMVGAEIINLHTSDYKQRQFINVVEEMSIASGVPLPMLYMLKNEPGINAFVAGYLPTEAVMVITEGAIQSLNRDELQGVIAHEYSHILNGDMLINIRLMSVIAGILMISSAGRLLMSRRSSHSVSRGRSAEGDTIIGIALLLVGFIGVFFGRLIKAAVSRQREYLADAASVQFTRNPQGIASALNKIREAAYGSKLNSEYAEEMSHMCFSQVFSRQFTKWQATHPPIEERIQRIDPIYLARIKARKMTEKNMQKKQEVASAVDVSEVAGMFSAAASVSAHEFIKTTGKIDQAHIEYARKVRQSFSENLMAAVHQVESAKVILLALILAKMDLQSGLNILNEHLDIKSQTYLKMHREEVFKLKKYQRLPLFDLLLPSLKMLDSNKKTEFIDLCRLLIKSDSKYTLFEFVLLSLLEQHLSESAGEDIKTKFHSFKSLSEELQLLFSIMIYCSGNSVDQRKKIYNKLKNDFSLQVLDLLPVKSITVQKIGLALKQVAQLSPILKKNVIEACADIAMDDGVLKTAEAELLRAISESLNSPLPPLLPPATG